MLAAFIAGLTLLGGVVAAYVDVTTSLSALSLTTGTLNSKVDNLNDPTTGVVRRLDDLQKENNTLSTQLGATTERLNALSEQLAELQRRYNNRFGADSRQLYNPPAPHDAPTTSVSKLDEEAQRKNDAKAAYVKANELAGSGNCEQAIPLYDTANSLVPGTAPKYKKAVCLDLIGKRVEAKASYDVVVATGASSDSNMNAAMIAQARNRSSELSTNDTDAGVVGAAPPLVPEY